MRIMPTCAVCGGATYTDRAVLWDSLAEGWGLSPEERALVDRQQGTCCTGCGGNLRSIALAEAIMAECGFDGTLREFVTSPLARRLRLLEINEAGSLTPTLRHLPSYVFGAYPELDMQAMHYPDASFDMIVHSDTLEHVPDPLQALKECARVLRPEGALCFTVPVLTGRLSLSRKGLQKLHHGNPTSDTDDLLVHTDYGAEVWHQVHEAGFASVTLSRFDDGLAITASRRTRRPRATDPLPVEMERLRASAAADLAEIRNSTSWRVTAPLRAAMGALRRLAGARR